MISKLRMVALVAALVVTATSAFGQDSATDKPSVKQVASGTIPQYAAPKDGEPGLPGRDGRNGRSGRDGRNADSTKIYKEVKSWDSLAKGGVDQEIYRKMAETKTASESFVVAKVDKAKADLRSELTTPAGSAGTVSGGSATTGGDNMSWQTILLIMILTGTLVGIVCWWVGALNYRRRSLLPEGHAQDSGYNPHGTPVNARFKRHITRDHESLEVEPFDQAVELARETSRQIQSNNATALQVAAQQQMAANLANSRQMLMANGPHQVVVVTPPPNYLAIGQGGNTGGADDAPRGFSIAELKELGVIKPPSEKKEEEKPKPPVKKA